MLLLQKLDIVVAHQFLHIDKKLSLIDYLIWVTIFIWLDDSHVCALVLFGLHPLISYLTGPSAVTLCLAQ